MSTQKTYTFPDGSTRILTPEDAEMLGLDPESGIDRKKKFQSISEVHIGGKPPTSSTGIIGSSEAKGDAPVVPATTAPVADPQTPVDPETIVDPATVTDPTVDPDVIDPEDPEGDDPDVIDPDDKGASPETKTQEPNAGNGESTEAKNKARTTAPNRARRTRNNDGQ